MTSLSRKIDLHHSVLQSFHWAGSASLWSYVTVLLLNLGFNNTRIGTLTGLALLGSILVQPALSSLVDRRADLTSRGMAMVLTVISMGAAAALWLFLKIPAAVTLCILLLGITLHIIPPFINAMVMEYSRRNIPVNFGLGPALIAYVCGRLVDALGVGSTLTFLCITAFLGCVIVWLATGRSLNKEAKN